MTQTKFEIKEATLGHLPDIHGVYSHHVLHGTGSFEERPPSLDAIAERWLQRESRQHPTLVAHCDGVFAGFAYAAAHKERSAYRFTVEDSVYISSDFAGKGAGRLLLNRLIELCQQRSFVQMIAVIGDSANHRSIALHEHCGFQHIGIAKGVGYKFDKWLDIVYMQRSLKG